MSIEIETLGTLRVRVDGAELPDLPGQPIRCGLLLHLAVQTEVGRDQLIRMFWSDRKESLARHSLNQTLSQLTQDLGLEDWIERRPDRIRLTHPTAIDVATFERRAAEAVGDRARPLSGSLPGRTLPRSHV
jgi:DNA-binding SARP family transcriptional activator